MERPCPECGEILVHRGTFCRECGYDAELAGGEDAYLDEVELPAGYGDDAEFDYDAALAQEGLGGEGSSPAPRAEPTTSPLWLLLGAAALLALLLLLAA